jgi:hypothetical protein
MRIFFAFVWLRWRLLVNGIRGGQRRDAFERISRVLALAVPLVVVTLSFGSVLAISVVAFLGGRTLVSGLVEWPTVLFTVRAVLAGVVGLVVLFAAIAPTESGMTRYTRLLLLPIPARALHLVEVASSLIDPWILFPAFGLATFALAILLSGWVRTSAVAAAAGLLFLALMAVLGALISFMVNWLVRNRRRGELFTLIFVLSLSLISIVPALMSDRLDSRREERRQPRQRFSIERVERALPAWTILVPSEQYGWAVRAAIERQTGSAVLALLCLSAETALLFAASSAVHRRLIDSLEGTASARRTGTVRGIGRRIPGLSPAASAVAVAQVRTALRSVRGRLTVLLPGPMVALMALAFRRLPEGAWAEYLSTNGYLLLAASLLFGIYALQPFTMNLFGSDRAGLTMQFLAPASDVDLARGKIAGCAILLASTQVLALVAALAVAPGGSAALWVAALLGGFSVFFLLSPIGVWFSALFPVASDLSKAGGGGNPHPLPTIAGSFIVLALAVPPALILAIAVWAGRPSLVLLVMAAWTLVAAAIAWPLITLSARAIGARRENLALVAQGR